MLKKLQRRFVLIAVGSFFAVLLSLLIWTNWMNYHNITYNADWMLQGVAEMNGLLPGYSKSWQGGGDGRRRGFKARYFIVSVNGGELETDLEHIGTIDGGDARDFYDNAASSGKTKGYYRGFRFLVTENGAVKSVICLSCEPELARVRLLLLLSGGVLALSTGVIYLLVWLLSRRAVKPLLVSAARQKQFITDAGHELKTPLTVITTSADVLEADLPDNEWLRNIKNQSARMTELVANMITIAKMDEVSSAGVAEQFSLSDALWDTAAPFISMAEAAGKRFSCDIEDDIQYRGDPSAIARLIVMLLDNAVKYSDDGGEIELSLKKQKKSVVMQVYNTCDLHGAEALDRLFGRFYRDDAARSRRTGGSGIGLSVARAIAEAHGGSIHASGEEGRSITFTVTL